MEVQFKNRNLKKQYEDYSKAQQEFGQQVGRRYIQRINIIKRAKDIEELKQLPGLRCHQLKGKHKGKWAVKLTRFYRLIFTLSGSRLEIVRIEEVSKHYGD